MDTSIRATWFVGDLDDPWVKGIASALPQGTRELARTPMGEWPEACRDALPTGLTLIVHLALVTNRDIELLARMRKERTGEVRVILCVGSFSRHADIVQCASLVDVILHEATARDVIRRYATANEELGQRASDGRGAVKINVVSSNFELRQILVEICRTAGYEPRPCAGWDEVGTTGKAISLWDVPVLEPGWGETLRERAHSGEVIALIGLPDREHVREARRNGAIACLELPGDPADLIEVLDRRTALRADGAHDGPPAPRSQRRARDHLVDQQELRDHKS